MWDLDIFIWFSELRDTIEEWVDRFFQNPGERIKSISRWNFLVMTLAGIVGGIIWGILLEEAWLAILLGFCGLLVGIIFGWTSSIMLYAFGEIVDNVVKTRNNLYLIRETLDKQFVQKSTESNQKEDSYQAPEYKTPWRFAD